MSGDSATKMTTKIRTDLLKQTLENVKNKQFTKDDLNTAITGAKQVIQERHTQEIEVLKAEVELLDNFIKPTSDVVVNELELCKMKIQENKLYAENKRNQQTRRDYVNMVIKDNDKMIETIEQCSFF